VITIEHPMNGMPMKEYVFDLTGKTSVGFEDG